MATFLILTSTQSVEDGTILIEEKGNHQSHWLLNSIRNNKVPHDMPIIIMAWIFLRIINQLSIELRMVL